MCMPSRRLHIFFVWICVPGIQRDYFPWSNSTDKFGYIDIGEDWKKHHFSRWSLYPRILSLRRSFLGQSTVIVGDCHWIPCHYYTEVFCSLNIRRPLCFRPELQFALAKFRASVRLLAAVQTIENEKKRRLTCVQWRRANSICQKILFEIQS